MIVSGSPSMRARLHMGWSAHGRSFNITASSHLELTLAYDLIAFEGDWWLLIEEQYHDRSSDQRWTLRDGRALNLDVEMGTYSLDGDCLVIGQPGQGLTMRLNPHNEYPLDS